MSLNDTLIVAGMALVTFLVRYPMMVLVGRFQLPLWVQQSLRYVPVAVLTAIIVPSVVIPPSPRFALPYLIAAVVAGGVGWWRNNLLLTIVSGMGTLWLCLALNLQM